LALVSQPFSCIECQWHFLVHGWDYRRYIIRQLDLKDNDAKDKVLDRAQSEFEFTTTKIHQNFSNYSAWHNRSTLLGKLAEDMSTKERENIVDNEFDLVKNAIYTDPEDQSAWLYELWLIGRGVSLHLKVQEIRGEYLQGTID
jgi:geranylgeranyl transferase type-2 subunit alpha